ncbi:MAG: hypothetical protein KF691_14695 [Phycisphaeraceae bacterium]|nr:hypothetical protein [Phycisphaeraceae bacterium]
MRKEGAKSGLIVSLVAASAMALPAMLLCSCASEPVGYTKTTTKTTTDTPTEKTTVTETREKNTTITPN